MEGQYIIKISGVSPFLQDNRLYTFPKFLLGINMPGNLYNQYSAIQNKCYIQCGMVDKFNFDQARSHRDTVPNIWIIKPRIIKEYLISTGCNY